MGMLRTSIIVAGALVLLPSPPPDESGRAENTSPGSLAYLAAAAETFADIRGFCQRNPGVCHTAGALAETLEGKVKYAAKLIYEWANEASQPPSAAGRATDLALASPVPTPSLSAPASHLKQRQNTLTVADLVPPWKKPKPLP